LAVNERLAVVLFNLGGPDSPAAVRPFLFNLFSDPAIIGLPQPLRGWLARIIAARREPAARAIYAHLGGRSPLAELTRQQAAALEGALGDGARVFVALRYWHPLTEAVVAEVKAWRPDRVVLLPLYPQYSTTTTASSLTAWRRAAMHQALNVPTAAVCCYPRQAGMIAAQVDLLKAALERAGSGARVLFSAHGLPKKIVRRGDPYPLQVEMTARAIVQGVGQPGLDWRVCYQSRVGPLEWIGPATDAEIGRAGAEARPLVVQPIAFVSEHSETLVELDIDYAHLANVAGVPLYVRVPAVGTHPLFVNGLADLVRHALAAGRDPRADGIERCCPPDVPRCGQSGG
jgi:ferrochelatase